jgi:hypothetical protein
MRPTTMAYAAAIAALALAAQGEEPAAAPASPLARKYTAGEVIAFDMRASNRGHLRTLEYSAHAQGVVRVDAGGHFYEDFAWSNLVVDGKPIELPPASQAFRQHLSLAPGVTLKIPNLAQVHPNLIGPVLDLLNFYADLGLAARLGGVAKAGDHVHFAHNRPNSWADGRMILVGEDAIDFDVTLEEVDAAARKATLAVRHVPPERPAIRITADWMRAPVAASANNWTQIGRYPPGKYSAAVGSEVIEVRLTVDLDSGRILSATMNNPVEVLERECEDPEARRCGEPVRYRILRTIQLTPSRPDPEEKPG